MDKIQTIINTIYILIVINTVMVSFLFAVKLADLINQVVNTKDGQNDQGV